MKPLSHHHWHFARPELAKKYLQLFQMGLTSARALFARRRMGKTEFLKNDFIPAAEKAGYIVIYINLWDLEIDPATALVAELYKKTEIKGFRKAWTALSTSVKKVKASGKIPGVAEGSIEADLKGDKPILGTLLMEAMSALDKTKVRLIFVIDEAQVLAYEENSIFAHALRAALDIRKDRIKVIFAGSSESTLRRMFGVPSEPFYNWAPLEPFELLGSNFVEAMVERISTISKYPLALNDALDAFAQLKNTPEFFRRYIECYITNPLGGKGQALEMTKSKVFSEDSFKQEWDMLLAADKVILKMLTKGIADLYGKAAREQLAKELGLDDGVYRNTVLNALGRLTNKNIVTKIEHGRYQFEDEAFADWIIHQD